MARVGTVEGLKIFIYPRDHNPPHVHVRLIDGDVVVEIDSGEVTRGELPRNKAKAILAWVNEHREALGKAWKQMQNGIEPEPIS